MKSGLILDLHVCFLGSIVTSAITKRKTALLVALANLVKRKHLIHELSLFGVTSSYDEFLLFKGSAADSAMENGFQKIKSGLENQKLIQVVADNFDSQIYSPNALKQTHSMAVILTQEQISTELPDFNPVSIPLKSKKDLQFFIS